MQSWKAVVLLVLAIALLVAKHATSSAAGLLDEMGPAEYAHLAEAVVGVVGRLGVVAFLTLTLVVLWCSTVLAVTCIVSMADDRLKQLLDMLDGHELNSYVNGPLARLTVAVARYFETGLEDASSDLSDSSEVLADAAFVSEDESEAEAASTPAM